MQGTIPDARRRGRPRTAWMDNIKTWTGLSVVLEQSIRMTEIKGESMHIVWSTCGSRTHKEQSRIHVERHSWLSSLCYRRRQRHPLCYFMSSSKQNDVGPNSLTQLSQVYCNHKQNRACCLTLCIKYVISYFEISQYAVNMSSITISGVAQAKLKIGPGYISTSPPFPPPLLLLRRRPLKSS